MTKIAVITGAAGGLGLALAEIFAKSEYHSVLLDIKQASLEEAMNYLKKQQLECSGYICDVTDENSVQQVVLTILKKWERIDVLINNAGMQFVAPIEEFPVAKFKQLLDVMLTAPFILMKQILPAMKKQNFGRIINMASVNGLIGFAGKSAYNSAKHGLVGLSKVIALESANYDITVNALCPGYVNTSLVANQLADLSKSRGMSHDKVLEDVIFPFVPQKRLLEPLEVANYALYLASPLAKGITGQALAIDGGYTCQ